MVTVARARRRHRAGGDGAAGRRVGRRLGRPRPRNWSPTAACGAGCSVCSARHWHSVTTSSHTRRAGDLLAGDVTLPSADELRATFRDLAEKATDATDALQPLQSLYRDRLLVLAGLDLASTVENEPVLPFTTVGEHLSDLADAALGAAMTVAHKSVGSDEAPRLAVIAMGKCGARELNYVSDVDVIFVAEGSPDKLAIATRVAGEMMRFAGDAFFEVDAALRPEGKQGQLVRTLDSHVAYYQRWAKTWEFQALMKARPAAGDAELGKQYIDALMPMVWTACEREDFVPEVQAMRRRVVENCARRRADPRDQTRHRRAARRRVRGPAAAVGARPQRRIAARGVDGRRAGRARRWRLHRPRRRGEPDGVVRVPATTRAPAAAAAAQAHAHASRRRRRRGAALAGAGRPCPPRRHARRPRRAARRAQAAEHAGVAAARQTLLSTAAGIGWRIRDSGGIERRRRRTPAGRAGLRRPAERADASERR